MSRLARLWRVLTGVAVAGALVAATPGTALAQSTPRPVIDSAPDRIRFKGDATIRGHLQDSNPGDRVSLQRKTGSGEWRTLATEAVDESSEVRFRVRDVRTSRWLRLFYRGDAETPSARSAAHRLTVAPRLTFRIRKDDVMEGRRVRYAGRLYPVARERDVVIEHRMSGRWRVIERAHVSDGTFSGAFRYWRDGRRRIRARFAGDAGNIAAVSRDRFHVYSPDRATWYGPGFYGNRTACGQRLGYNTLGVAHRRLPCGTEVSLLYGGRTVTVKVIDRGPYSHANWDLTSETAERLGFKSQGSGTLGASH